MRVFAHNGVLAGCMSCCVCQDRDMIRNFDVNTAAKSRHQTATSTHPPYYLGSLPTSITSLDLSCSDWRAEELDDQGSMGGKYVAATRTILGNLNVETVDRSRVLFRDPFSTLQSCCLICCIVWLSPKYLGYQKTVSFRYSQIFHARVAVNLLLLNFLILLGLSLLCMS